MRQRGLQVVTKTGGGASAKESSGYGSTSNPAPPPPRVAVFRTRGLPTPKYNDNELFQAMEGEAVR